MASSSGGIATDGLGHPFFASTSNVENTGPDKENQATEDNTAPMAVSRRNTSKRRYRVTNRTASAVQIPERPINMRKRVKAALIGEQGPAAARNEKCCAKQCFRVIPDVDFLARERKHVLGMSRAERKLYLMGLFDRGNNRFLLDGVHVCTKFLVVAFRYSNDTICSVRGTPKCRSTAVVDPLPRLYATAKRDTVVTFLRQLAEAQGDRMPDRSEVHLTYRSASQVFGLLEREWESRWSSTSEPMTVSFSYFTRVWKESCNDIKIRSVHRFALCDTCETLKAKIEKCGVDVTAAKPFRDGLIAHYDMVKREREAYRDNQAKAAQFPAKYCSVIIDGANQEAFSLPHFAFTMKAETTGYSMKMGLIGLLEHMPGRIRSLSLFTMAEDMETGANHIIEVLHRWLEKKASKGPLPPILLIQMDNCSRENKNKFLFGYLEFLVSVGIFEEIQASFLPKGHTHEDIDQVFSCTAKALRPSDAITLSDLHEILRGSYTPEPDISHLHTIANIRDCLRDSKSLLPVEKLAFTQYRYFVFARRVEGDSSRVPGEKYHYTMCSVKGSVNGTFQLLRSQTGQGQNKLKGFLRCPPDLRNVPHTESKALGLDVKAEVTKRLNALETRIDNASKLAELRSMRDEVYRDEPRVTAFAWLDDCIEIRATGNHVPSDEEDGIDSVDSESDSGGEQETEYETGTFVAVRAENEEDPFWVAKIRSVRTGATGLPRALDLFWYQARKQGDCYNSSYFACVQGPPCNYNR